MSQIRAARQIEKDQEEKWGTVLYSANMLQKRYQKIKRGWPGPSGVTIMPSQSYQYGYIDKKSALAWRQVWEAWRENEPNTAPDSPCRLDFLLYRVGKEYCKDMLAEYVCEKGHVFYHFGGKLRNCRRCALERHRIPVRRERLLLPCQADAEQLPQENGRLLLDANNLLSTFGGVCIFTALCRANTPDFKPLEAPRSISIKGQTSWTDSYADKGRGGGGMMG
jgi:hypothetical protein